MPHSLSELGKAAIGQALRSELSGDEGPGVLALSGPQRHPVEVTEKLLFYAALLLIATSAPALAQTGGKIAMEEFTVPAKDDPDIQLYVRNKRPDGMTQFSSAKTVVFAHGATYPARPHLTCR